MSPQIISLSNSVSSESSTPAADRLIAGSPKQTIRNHFTDSTDQFFAGEWSSTPGTWRVRYTENELCVMTRGRCIITSDDGAPAMFATGDAFVIPAGFSGTWEVLEDCTKIYAIFESST
ncbi:MAG: cupin domain-containing protein [Gammaproteobacteria bacterium]